MASAKLAKSTVNHSHNVICRPKPNCPARCKVFRINSMVVSRAPTSTTNMTGFLTIVRGFSLVKESTIARETIFLSARGLALAWDVWSMDSSEGFSGEHQQVFQDRSEAERRKKCERAY